MPNYASFPGPELSNPFQIPLAYALEEEGWSGRPMVWWPLSLWKHRKRIPILHFHWPESYWRASSQFRSYSRALKYVAMIWLAKLLGYKLVWSAHNVMPHFTSSEKLEKRMRLFILEQFDLVVGHAENCENDLINVFGISGKKYVLAPHGHYEGLYLPTESRDAVIRSLQTEQSTRLILLMGGRQDYKGVGDFIRVWVQRGRRSGMTLVITGELDQDLESLIVGRNDVRRRPQRPGRYELANLVAAADFVALPYRRITTSGAYFMALTLQVPVIAPTLPFFKQHSTHDSALLYDQNSTTGLEDVLRKAAEGWEPDRKQLAELKHKYDWRISGRILASEYRLLMEAP